MKQHSLLLITVKAYYYFFFNFVATTALIKVFISFQSQKYSCCLVTESCSTLCNPMDCSMPDFPVLHCLLEFSQTYVHWVSGAIQPSHPLSRPIFSCPQSFPASGSFPMSQLFALHGQSIGGPASASVLPMNIQVCFPLGLTGLISLQSKGLSRVFSNTIVQKHHTRVTLRCLGIGSWKLGGFLKL